MTDDPQTRSPTRPEILPLGPDGVVLRVALRASDAASARVQALAAALRAAPPQGMAEMATALASVWLRFDPALVSRAEFLARLSPFLDMPADPPPAPVLRRWTVPAAFGGQAGPQLAELAALTGQTEAAAVAGLCAADLRVLAIGFAPGQPYLGLLPPDWDIPRQTALTPQVPAGALVVAVRQVVLFANASATGWRQAGRCAFRPFLPDRAQPFALRAGDAIRFAPVAEAELAALEGGDGLGGARLESLA
ncbi:5-oxoprolinase subunit B family protein [Szabonella alba]|uniref:Carboxyltransferase domain-containing protein n=1 Tax=Szabonella alba TaxID=2804194 RepID=A0A8K0VBK1_9RHOB|nr:carboxyltransferase domain-containing protein [Szabonella alba]MBL4916242.1 carboxyltransferase domain-containing protein [Szabonella alba]